jgi:hypothetical protein
MGGPGRDTGFHVSVMKSEIRNPESESSPKVEARLGWLNTLGCDADFGFRISFGFRLSRFGRPGGRTQKSVYAICAPGYC